jgi:hypothetical protein
MGSTTGADDMERKTNGPYLNLDFHPSTVHSVARYCTAYAIPVLS